MLAARKPGRCDGGQDHDKRRFPHRAAPGGYRPARGSRGVSSGTAGWQARKKFTSSRPPPEPRGCVLPPFRARYVECPAPPLAWLTAPTPTVNGDQQICTAPDLALVLARLGEPAHAGRLADVGLAAWERAPGLRMPQDRVCRVRLLAVAGRRDDALAEFKRAVDLGFRNSIDWGFVSIEDDPTLDPLRDDPRFKTQMKRIRDDLARQRLTAEAWLHG